MDMQKGDVIDNFERSDSIVYISDDKMTATLDLVKPQEGSSYTVKQLILLLNSNGVKQGINQQMLQQMIDNQLYYTATTVAQGKVPKDGQDGRYQFFFQVGKSSTPKVLPDGTVDYLNMDLFESVTVGQVVAEYIPATNGEYGYTVAGDLMTPKKGANLPPLRGSGFTVSEDKKQYISILNGKVELKDDGKLEISNIYNITGNLDISIGNVRFDGDVYVSGNVSAGLSIMAKGNVVIDGTVESVNIRSGGDVILRKGMMGGGEGKIEAEGSVTGRFFEAVTIKAKGPIRGDYFLNCKITTEDILEVTGVKGVILGGSVRALKLIKAQTLGNSAELPTIVETGVTDQYMRRYNEIGQMLAKVDSEVSILERNAAMFETAAARARKVRVDDPTYLKIKQVLQMKYDERERLHQQRKEMSDAIAMKGNSKVRIIGTVFPGVKVIIDSEILNVADKVKNVEFILREGNVTPMPKYS
ncbi:MAG: FapA family protein [Lachnospiraceae bacterium]|nr:FapA family protein [Lachnospiraceae bacterium]